MKKLQLAAAALGLTLAGAMCATPARADALAAQLTKVTFSEPVDLPGVVLLPGTYEFRLVDSVTDMNQVEIHADGTQLIKILETIPVSRPRANAGDAQFVLERLSSNTPEAVKEWFYPGDTTGHEFLYPHHKLPQNEEPLAKAQPSSHVIPG